MAHANVVAAVRAQLANWTACLVFEMNTVMEPPADGSPWLEVQYPFCTTERMSVGTRYYREIGGVRLVVAVPQGTGVDPLLALTGQLQSLFRDVRAGSVRFKVPSAPYLDDGSDDGAWFEGAVVVPYEYTYSG